MNRKDALTILDRLHSDDLRRDDGTATVDPAVRSALAAVESDPELRRVWERRAAFDRRASDLLQDVEVPADLHGRLLSALGLEEHAPSVPAAEPTRPGATRRAWTRTVLAASLAVAALGLAWWWNAGAGIASVDPFDVAARAAERFDEVETLPEFAGEFPARLPWSGWRQRFLRVGDPPRGLPLGPASNDARTSDDARTVAVYPFEVVRGDAVHRGLLIAVPTAWLAAPPADEFFNRGSAVYVEPRAAVAWREGELTFVCVADAETLDLLGRMLQVRSA